jgi:hypothetical protein
MDKYTLAAAIRVGMFGERDTVGQAFTYAEQMLNAMSSADAIAARTLLHVVLNTVAKEIQKLDIPAPEADGIRIADAAQLDQRIDARIAAALADAAQLDQRIDTRIDVFLMDDKINRWADDNLDGYIEQWIGDNLSDKIESWVDDNLDVGEHVDTWFDQNGSDIIRDALSDAEITVKVK